MRATRFLLITALLAALPLRTASATESCGNGADDDANGQTDEGCFPAGVTGVCESPLSCGVTGSVSPSLGAVVYPFQPDVSFTPPYGPPVSFRRTYTSQYSPGYSFPAFKAPLGYRMQHSYMSWVLRGDHHAILHTTTGQDVYFMYDQVASGWTYYTPQDGHFYTHLRQKATSPYNWELKTLTGEIYGYNWDGASMGKLVSIYDRVGNKVSLTYNVDGRLEKIEDASGHRWLKLEYMTGGLVQYVKLYSDPASPTLHLTVEYGYSSSDLTTVSVGGTTIESNTWTDHLLTQVQDGGSKVVASFAYISGKVARVGTGAGDVGYAYGACGSGAGTYLYFHRASTTACDSDADCGTGLYCGGETSLGSGNTGWCFKARRCATLDTSAGETLVDSVTGSCSSCTAMEDYVWDTSSLRVTGTMTADDVKTSYLRNANGLVTKMVENDSDYDASTVPASGARVTWYFFGDSSYPGLVTEVRRQSELSAATCNDTTTTGCKRTVYAYTTAGLVDTVTESGFTLDSSGAVVSYSYLTDYTWDSLGRLTQVTGPRSGIDDTVEYAYWASGSGLSTDYLREVKRKKDATSYVTTTHGEYTFWGQAALTTDPDSTIACRTFNSIFGLVESSKVVTGGQTSCASATGNETTFRYDTHRRLSKVTRPRGNCTRTSYDSEGRIETEVEADYDSGAGDCGTSGNTRAYTYDTEGRTTKVELKDSGGTVKKRQEYQYATDRRVSALVNPVSMSYLQRWYYDDDGVPSEVRWEDFSTSDARTQWDVDSLNRTTAIRKYTTSTSAEDWTITPGVQLDLPTRVRDEASHDLDFVWDDLGRKVKQVSAEGGTNLYVHDAAGNLETLVEADGSADEKTSTFTYDGLNRRLTWNTGDAACYTLGSAELQYTYDALPAGASCPGGSSCDRLAGRLARVKVKIFCDDAQADDTFDQATFYSYTAADQIAEHTVVDDGGRTARVVYAYDTNGNVTGIDYPSGATTGAQYVYGGVSGEVADDDRIGTVRRYTTNVLYYVKHAPFGSPRAYMQSNVFVHSIFSFAVQVDLVRNLAFRLSYIFARSTYSTPDNVFRIDSSEDVRQRYTSRDFSYGSAGQKDMYFLYDDLSRTTCRTTTSQSSCPTSGDSPIDNIAYNTSGDRSVITFANAILAARTYYYVYVSATSDRLSCIRKDTTGGCNLGATRIAYTWDGRGNRTADNDSEYTGSPDPDARTFTYDGRNNLITVQGRYWYATNDLNSYVVTNAYDERNRRVFKSFVDTDLDVEAQWFFYYDQFDRLIEAKYTPDISSSSTYTVYQWYWLEQTPFLYYQIDYPGATTTRRYLHGDEQGRPHVAWNWPTSGSTTRVWEVEAGLFGWDIPVVGPTVFQPLRFPGQFYDRETEAVTLGGSGEKLVKRPGATDNWHRSYDSLSGSYLSADKVVTPTSDTAIFAYALNDPVGHSDPDGRMVAIAGTIICAEGPLGEPNYQDDVDFAPEASGCWRVDCVGGGGSGGGGTPCSSPACDPDMMPPSYKFPCIAAPYYSACFQCFVRACQR